MKVCFMASQIFAWGKFGGFGSLTRLLGRELVKKGVEVSAIVPGRSGQKKMEIIDGIKVFAFPQWTLGLFSGELYRSCDADVYHSEEPSMGTWVAMKAMPDKKHVVTFQDPRNRRGWITEFLNTESFRRKLYFPILYFYERNLLIEKTVRKADATFCQAKSLCSNAQSIFGLTSKPGFLPNPVRVPNKLFEKNKQPTVCFLGRLDPVKKPEVFFELSKKFPKVQFVAIGKAENPKRDLDLRKKYGDIPNLELKGFINQFSSGGVYDELGKSWILINTSAKEALPVSWLEAAACQCAILSPFDTDGFATSFGYHVHDGNFVKGLSGLLEGNRWRDLGLNAYEYVKKTHEVSRVINEHILIYRDVINN